MTLPSGDRRIPEVGFSELWRNHDDWISFYDFKHSVIYVNARHRDVHYRTIANDIRGYVPSPEAHVLDYGCGEATSAALVADACAQLILVEAAPNVRASLTMRYAGHPKIAAITPDQAMALPAGSLDLIVLHSVAQYLTPAEFDFLAVSFRKLLKPGGLLVVGDIVPPHLAAPAAALTLLRLGAANGFFWAAAFGLMRIFGRHPAARPSGCRITKRQRCWPSSCRRLCGQRAPRNIGHNAAHDVSGAAGVTTTTAIAATRRGLKPPAPDP